MTRLVLAACAALALLPLGSAAQTPGPLQRLLQAELARIPAKAGIYVKHLKTGEEATVRADESFNSASVIKIPVFVIGYQMAEKKTLDLDARVTIAKADKRGGSGVLRYHETTTREARFPCTATTCSINRRTWRGTRRGNSYFTDGYVNSRVAKANARGEWVASWGSLGTGPGQFDTPHGIAVSPTDEIYVADRGNRRIQVLDTEGKFLREFTIDVPVDTKRGKITYGAETPNPKTGSQAPGAPDALGMTPGPNPVLFVGDLYPSRIYKVSLEGKVLGVYRQPGRNLGEFGWIHAIACPSENEIWVGELINWRVQKLVTKKGGT